MPGTMRAHGLEISSEAKLGKDAILYSSTFVFTSPEESIMLLLVQPKEKPQAILDYNATKVGVDTADEILRAYSTKAASRRWPLAAFFNLVDITALGHIHYMCEYIDIKLFKT